MTPLLRTVESRRRSRATASSILPGLAVRRTISLSDSLVTMLLDQPTFGDTLVFTTASGTPVRRSAFRTRVWLPAVEASVGRPMRAHDLRHTHAALLIAQSEHACQGDPNVARTFLDAGDSGPLNPIFEM